MWLLPINISSQDTFSLQVSTHFSFIAPPSIFSADPFPPAAQPRSLHNCQIFPSLPSYPKRRCWSLAEIWRSQKWSVAGPWSFHTGQRLWARACRSQWVEPAAGQSCRFLLSEGSHGDPRGGRNRRRTGHLKSNRRWQCRILLTGIHNTQRKYYLKIYKGYFCSRFTVFLWANDYLDTIAKTKKKPLSQLFMV